MEGGGTGVSSVDMAVCAMTAGGYDGGRSSSTPGLQCFLAVTLARSGVGAGDDVEAAGEG